MYKVNNCFGKRDKMSGQVKNQHYIPRMYLNRFSENSNRITVWDINKDVVLPRQLAKNFAAKRYFYDASKEELRQALSEMIKLYPIVEEEMNKADEQMIEHALGRCESDAAKVLDVLEYDYEKLYNEDIQRTIIIFLHELAYRTEAFRTSLDNIRDQAVGKIAEMGIDINDVEGMEKDGKDIQLYELFGIAPLLKTTQMLMDNYNWHMGIVQGKMKLLISDDVAKNIWLGFNDICIPISSEKAMIFRIADETAPLLSKDKPEGNIIKLSERSVFAYNVMQLSHANRFMFGDKYSIEFLKRMRDGIKTE